VPSKEHADRDEKINYRRLTLHAMKITVPTLLLISLFAIPCSGQGKYPMVDLSGEFLYAVRTGDDTREYEERIATISKEDLLSGLPDDRARKTFWINIYNAWYQILAGREKLTSPDIFKASLLKFRGFSLSLDEVEHGILRKYRAKYGLGVVPDLLADRTIRSLAVEKLDFRIHFALNCGARSCPPIAFYSYDKLEQELELATTGFLKADCRIDEKRRTISVTKIMEWFTGDFGGKPGQRKLLSQYLGRDFTSWAITYHDYDWTPQLNNFSGGER